MAASLFKRFPAATALERKTELRRKLLRWFDANQRDLPWRRNPTPYRIWVSEIMLQQTQVATVIEYYRRFMRRFPSTKKLAAAELSEVLKLWEGLGYYRRARQLHAAARMIVEQYNGRFPTDFDQVVGLPGIGRYTAGAILSIARDQPFPIVEGNTMRLFARLMLMRGDPRANPNQKYLWQFSQAILPTDRAGDFNQALMELGSEVCRVSVPSCEKCPLRRLCPTSQRGLQRSIPAVGRKLNYESVNEAAVIVKRGSRFLVRQYGPAQRWAGLWDFPRFETNGSRPNLRRQLSGELKQLTGLDMDLRDLGRQINHSVTRFRITLSCWGADNVRGRLKSNGDKLRWVNSDELERLAMSVTGRKIAREVCICENPRVEI